MDKKRLVIGVSGASGAPLAIELLQQLKKKEDVETHLVMSYGAELTIAQESEYTPEEVKQLADVSYDNREVGAAIASGSFRTMGMIVIPCSMKTAAGIVSGYSDNLLLRAADVTLKEGRRLILVPRECPLGTIHLRNLYELSQLGAIIIPPMLSYYNHPGTVEDCTRHIVGKVLDRMGMEGEGFRRWNGMDG
ncbi:MAG: UbiX family flavin prenyltransferase [Lachnospiraceae bacterium]